MKRPLLLLALCAIVAVPVAAFGQAGPPGMPGPPPAGQRATMEKARAEAKAAAYLALTPAHRDRVTAIVADVAAGKRKPREASKLIDDLLTPDEQKAVRDVAQSARRGGPAGGPPPGAPGPPPGAVAGAAGPPPPQGRRFSPSAGRSLIMLSLTREQMRSLMPRARSSSAP